MYKKEINSYKLYKKENKEFIYKSIETLVYAELLKRWICSNPNIIKKILCDERFDVIYYNFAKINTRFDIAIDEILKIQPYISLSFDGPLHLELRKKIALLISKKSESALVFFKDGIEKKLSHLIKSGNIFDMSNDVLKPLIRNTIVHLSNCENPHQINIDHLSSIFDETADITSRILLNDTISQCNIKLQNNDEDDIYFKIAFIAMGVDSSLGTLSESLISVLIKNKNIRLSEIDWPNQIPSTGVPVIERIANTQLEIEGIKINKGERVRLYLDAAGYQYENTPSYASLYFGSGSHACLGASIGRKFWTIFIQELSKYSQCMKIIDLIPKSSDNVFNKYDHIKLEVYDKN